MSCNKSLDIQFKAEVIKLYLFEMGVEISKDDCLNIMALVNGYPNRFMLFDDIKGEQNAK